MRAATAASPDATDRNRRPAQAVVAAFYQALKQRDVAQIVALLDPAVEWTEAERFPYFSGTWKGPQEIIDRLLVPLGRDWEYFEVTPEDYIVEGDRLVAFGRYAGRYRSTGLAMEAAFAHHWAVAAGKIVKFVMYTDTAKVMEALAGDRPV